MPATGKNTSLSRARANVCTRRLLAPLAVIIGLLVVSGCNDKDAGGAVEARMVSEPQPDHVPGQTSAVRFGYSQTGSMDGAPSHGASPSGSGGGGLQLGYATPEGWAEIPAGQFTLVRFKIGGNDDSICTLSTAGGGLVPNLNRWRGQMGLAALGESEVAALTRIPMLGGEALLVEMTGTLKGKADTTMLGALVQHEGKGVFAKLTAPATIASAERERFIALCASLDDGHNHGGGSSAPGDPAPASSGNEDPHAAIGGIPAATQPADADSSVAPSSGQFAGGTMAWSTPEGWSAGRGSSIRLVTLIPAGAKSAEFMITPLLGEAGGVAANLDQWRKQVGLDPLSPEEFAALPSIDVLGAPCKFIEIEGELPARDGSGSQTMRLMGLVASAADHSIFIKMTGPVEEVDAARGGFMQIVESLALGH